MLTIQPGNLISFVYANWRGETSERQALVRGFEYGVNDYHPDPQFYMRAYCLDRKAYRCFAVKDMTDIVIVAA